MSETVQIIELHRPGEPPVYTVGLRDSERSDLLMTSVACRTTSKAEANECAEKLQKQIDASKEAQP